MPNIAARGEQTACRKGCLFNTAKSVCLPDSHALMPVVHTNSLKPARHDAQSATTMKQAKNLIFTFIYNDLTRIYAGRI
jgi:hypothetical protein